MPMRRRRGSDAARVKPLKPRRPAAEGRRRGSRLRACVPRPRVFYGCSTLYEECGGGGWLVEGCWRGKRDGANSLVGGLVTGRAGQGLVGSRAGRPCEQAGELVEGGGQKSSALQGPRHGWAGAVVSLVAR